MGPLFWNNDMTDKSPSGAPWRNFYGRLKGKHMKDTQKGYVAEDLVALSLPNVSWKDNPDRTELDMKAQFGDHPVWLEVGFGGGEHMVHQAIQNPDVQFLGCEPYINGVGMLLGKMRKEGVENITLHAGDARDVMDILPTGSIDRAFLLYPDPWPKKRHHRRRFVTPEHLDPLARCLMAGAIFRIATDIEDYVRQTMEQMTLRDDFEWLAETADDWRVAWPDWHSTRYEQKALREGRKPHYMTFRKL